MGDAEESRRMENLSLQANRFPRDLLQRFMGGGGGGGGSSSRQSELVVVKEENSGDEIELNLGLSLGGRFGVDKSSSKLVRSSSIAGPIPIVRDGEALTPAAAAAAYPTLARTSSLPVETEDEWRKRKEMQTLRRMEAKRRRSEKQRNWRGEKDGSGGCSGSDERREIEANLRGRNEREQYIAAMTRVGSSVMPPFKLPRWPDAVARQASLGGGGRGGRGGGGSGNLQGFVQTTSQGSIESQGGSSSSVSELDTKPLQGSSSGGEVSPASIHSLQEQSNQNAGGSSGSLTAGSSGSLTGAEMESPSRSSDVAKNRGKETGTNSLGDMPCVFTKGDGPNGKRIEGILYKYGKGEEVRIMCVCHGNFYSPAGFVNHAGGRDVAQPLKHIVIKPNASSSF